MVFLVRRLTGGVDAEASDIEYEGANLVLGSSDNAGVALPGLDGDVVVKSGKGGSCSLSGRGVRLQIDDKEVSSGRLSVGESASAGGYRILIIDPPTGFDTALQIEAVEVEILESEDALHRAPFSLRTVGWTLALLILIGTLVLPLTSFLAPSVGEKLSELPLPDDALWSSGPLHEAHQRAGIADDCGACHSEPFVMVEDASCIACHGQLTEHAGDSVHPQSEFTEARCGSCHREHNEPQHLVRRDPPLCTDCHAEPADWQRDAGPQLRAVGGFSADAHPEFRVAHWIPKGPNGSLGWELERSPGPATQVEDTSGLKFNHEVHLDVEKVQREQSGEALACGDCHTLEDSGEHFETISMDAHCRDCHGLGFDSFEPDLELPHGDLRDVIVAMEAHFIREFTDPVLREARANKKPRRLVGKRFREAATTCEGSGLECGRLEAAREARYQLEETGCVTCHEVTDTAREELRDRWLIHPVRLTGDFFVESEFDHLSHLSQASESADALCESCHTASVSVTSTDLLMPAQDNCLQCHGDKQATVESDCVTCHSFHRAAGTPVARTRPL